MAENKIIIDGKEIELSDETVAKLKAELGIKSYPIILKDSSRIFSIDNKGRINISCEGIGDEIYIDGSFDLMCQAIEEAKIARGMK